MAVIYVVVRPQIKLTEPNFFILERLDTDLDFIICDIVEMHYDEYTMTDMWDKLHANNIILLKHTINILKILFLNKTSFARLHIRKETVETIIKT